MGTRDGGHDRRGVSRSRRGMQLHPGAGGNEQLLERGFKAARHQHLHLIGQLKAPGADDGAKNTGGGEQTKQRNILINPVSMAMLSPLHTHTQHVELCADTLLDSWGFSV